MSGKFYTEEKAGVLLQKDWFAEMRSNIKADVRDDWKGEKEIRRQYGDVHFVGYILKVGPQCTDVRHLNGLLVQIEDAFDAPELLPPYETCSYESCECDYQVVSPSEVPRERELPRPMLQQSLRSSRRVLAVRLNQKRNSVDVRQRFYFLWQLRRWSTF